MKQKYVKPDLYFDNFELATNIASCNHVTSTDQAAYECPLEVPIGDGSFTVTLFIESNGGCVLTPQTAGNICLGVPTGDTGIFIS